MRPPPPAEELDPIAHVWDAGREFVRCHDSEYGATEFNPRRDISQRFRPMVVGRRAVSTLYGSDLIDGALSETLFHAVPTDGPDRRVGMSAFVSWNISRIEPRRDLRLADLRDEALGRLELTREEVIESPATAYPETAAWAKALFESRLQPDGLIWNSRQDRSKEAIILFDRRVERKQLRVSKVPIPMAIGEGYELVIAAAERLGITITQ